MITIYLAGGGGAGEAGHFEGGMFYPSNTLDRTLPLCLSQQVAPNRVYSDQAVLLRFCLGDERKRTHKRRVDRVLLL